MAVSVVADDPLSPAVEQAVSRADMAPPGRRLLAAGVDLLVLLLLLLPVVIGIVLVFEVQRSTLGAGDALYLLVSILVPWLYHAGLESGVRQASLGKRLLGLVVTDAAGEPVTFGRASRRHFAKLLSALPLMAGFLAIFVTGRRQCLHDLIAGTLVLYRPYDAEDAF